MDNRRNEPVTADEAGKVTYTAREAMTRIGLSKNSFYEAVNRGEIPSVRIGRKILILKKPFDVMFE